MIYYNDNDSAACDGLWQLMRKGLLPAGELDPRSIADVEEVGAPIQQAHFFAGIGGWPYALQIARVPTDANIWTGSCPCQPFSGQGNRKGANDDRHLWPEFYRLIRQHRPAILFGEQVTGPLGEGWFDAVSNELEAEGYQVGATVLTAGGLGAWHKRARLYFGAYRTDCPGEELAHACSTRQEMAVLKRVIGHEPDWQGRPTVLGGSGSAPEWDAIYGVWREVDWLATMDDAWRPVKPGLVPLVDGIPYRVESGLYGNAIVPQVAAVFVRSFLDSLFDLIA